MEREVFLDFETTGLSPSDAVVEAGLVDRASIPLVNTLVYTHKKISPGAYNVHRIDAGMLQHAPRFGQVRKRILDLCFGADVVIYNAEFDVKFIPELKIIAGRIFCCMRGYQKIAGRRVTLQEAADALAFEWPGDSHRAVNDALACRHVWNHLPMSTRISSRIH